MGESKCCARMREGGVRIPSTGVQAERRLPGARWPPTWLEDAREEAEKGRAGHSTLHWPPSTNASINTYAYTAWVNSHSQIIK